MLMRMGMMWYMFNMFRGGQQQPSGAGTVLLKPLYAKGDLIDMKVFLSERAYYMPDNNPGQLIWEERGIGLASGPERKSTYMYEPSQVGGQGSTLGSCDLAAPSWAFFASEPCFEPCLEQNCAKDTYWAASTTVPST